ncbi:MAG: formyltetrahydrofolate deformylase [Phycisphaerales bacterium]|nr:formyltetrahydrofolate deformylase [Phycisphaerales bacterium]
MNKTRKVLAVISVQGRDQKGVVAKFATYVANRGINIEDMLQRVVGGVFIMDMLVDLRDMTDSLDELITGLLAVGRDIGMEVRVALQRTGRTKRLAVLVSREPHCLQALLELSVKGQLGGDIVAILSNHDFLKPLADDAGLIFRHHPSGVDPAQKASHLAWLLEELRLLEPDLVILARYMQILTPEIVRAFKSKIINIHPSLLPHFPGASPYRQAYESGVRVTGCTAHFVTEQLDQGPIILQDVFHINVGEDSADDVRERGLALEAQTLAKAVQYFLNEELVVLDDKVVFKPGINHFARPAGT